MKRPTRRPPRPWAAATAIVLTCPLAAPGAHVATAVPPPAYQAQVNLSEFTFAHDYILGTSLDLLVHTDDPRAALQCHRKVLAEIERLRRILSTYDPASEIRRVMSGSLVCSPELADVLDLYSLWSARTGNALHLNMSAVSACWRAAATCNRLPTPASLQDAFSRPFAWNVDALGKAFIIDRAVAVARRLAPAGLLDIGGDIRAWGPMPFTVAVADPHNSADNAPPLGTIPLQDAAVATSGGYARHFSVAGQRFSHLIDPRTLHPISPAIAATVVARDCVTANALSTATCILGAEAGARLAAQHDARPVDAPAPPRIRNLAAGAGQWPADYQLTLTLTLKPPQGGRKPRRPYVAVWIEDARGKVIRTVTVWGTQPKYLREMTSWWKAAAPDGKAVKSVTRATRDPGKYTIAWDGLDDAGKFVPQGDYTIVCEINREHGRHVGEKTKVTCGDKKVTATMKATAESEEATLEFAPKSK